MFVEESEEIKQLAEQNAALVKLLEKVHGMLKPCKGQDNFNGQLFRVLDLELFKAKNLNPPSDVRATRRTVGVEIRVVKKVRPARKRATR